MKKDLLVEILCEELPAIPFLKEEPHILAKWNKVASKFALEASFEFFYTPRRLVLLSRDFPVAQEEVEVEFFGPPLELAYIQGDIKQGLSRAGEGFLKKCNTTQVQSRIKDGREVMYFSQKIAGKRSENLLGEMITEWLESLHFGKSMRWGAVSMPFIRPIRNIVVFFDKKALDLEVWGLRISSQTFLHRDCGFEPKEIRSLDHYRDVLKQGGVILDPKERRSKILQEVAEIENRHNIKVELDSELLSEVVAITEHPSVLLGRFESKFLTLPKEIIITSMKENQRYFAVYKGDELDCGFVVVVNSTHQDTQLMLEGNEKVLKARLSDAMFFYRNDLKKPLASYDLSNIVFVEGLGSMQDKVQREKQIALYLLRGEENQDLLEAISIAKSDLLSEVVGEFPSLEGIMGSYYVMHEAKEGIPHRSDRIACAIREQYFHGGDHAPSSLFSAYVALSFRLDTLLSLFALGKIPSGSKDPYALRRAGNAVLRILQIHPIALSQEDLYRLSAIYPTSLDLDVADKLWGFLLERMEGVLRINASILRSVIKGGEKDLGKLMQKSLALHELFDQTDKEAMMVTFKRVANITKDAQRQEINSELFETPQEHELYRRLEAIKAQGIIEIKSYLRSLFDLRDVLDAFFESVMVNVEEKAVRDNRKALVYEMYLMFLEIGDIKEISN